MQVFHKFYVVFHTLYLKVEKVEYIISERTFRKGFRETPEESGKRNRK